MSNMSYCRFHNTLLAFKNCFNELEDAQSFAELKLSEDETKAMKRLAAYARLYLERYSELEEQEEYERFMDDGA